MKVACMKEIQVKQVGGEHQFEIISYRAIKLLKRSFIIILYFLCCTLEIKAQWTKDNTIEGDIIRAFAVNASYAFAGTSGGGIYRSSNNGTSWEAVNNGLPGFTQVFAMYASGANVLASAGGRLYITSNNGDLWTQVTAGLPTNSGFRSFVSKGANIFAAGSGVYYSTDSGITWINATGITFASGFTLTSIVTDGTNLFATNGIDLFVSGDDGANWSSLNTADLSTYSPSSNRIASLAVSGSDLYAGTNQLGVFKSSNNGVSWTPSNLGLTAKSIITLFVSGSEMFAGTGDVGSVFISSDGGSTWSVSNVGLSPNTLVRTFARSGSNLFAGTWAGVAISSDNGATWTHINSGMKSSTVWGIVELGGNLFAGTTAGVFRSTDNGVTWTKKNTGLTNTNVSSIATNGVTLYAGTLGTGGGGVFFSNDNGENWVLAANNGLTIGNMTVASLAAHGTTLIAGGGGSDLGLSGRIFRSTDNGSNWTEVSSLALPINQIKFIGTKVFAAWQGFFLVSTDDGATWANVSVPFTQGFGSDATASELYGATTGGVYVSTDQGLTWSGPGSSPIHARSIVVNGSNVFAGTSFSGIYFSPDKGVSWSQEIFPSTRVLSLTISGSKIFAGTQGQGIWSKSLAVPPVITSFTPASGPIGTTVTITGTNFDPIPASNTVRFNGTIAATPTGVTSTNLVVAVPTGSTTGPITVTTPNGTATSSTNFTVTCSPPPPAAGAGASICGSGSVTLNASGATGSQEYRWYNVPLGGTSLASTPGFATPVLSVTTTYYVTVFDVVTSCESIGTAVDAVVNTPPAPPTTTPSSGCSGTGIALTAAGGSPGLYRWYTVPTAGTANAVQQSETYTTPVLTTTTSYWVAVTNGTCESARTEAIATVLPLPSPPTISTVPAVCPGANLILTASGTSDGNYRWYEGGTFLPGQINGMLLLSNVIGNRTLQASIVDANLCESIKTSVSVAIKACTAPVIAPSSTAAFIEGVVEIDLCALISDPENDLDLTTLQGLGSLTSGAPFTISGCTLAINYSGTPFPGSDVLTIQVCDLTGLCTTQLVTIELGGEITVYNAVSPNGDGKNEIFYIEYIEVLPETRANTVTIFNRWGDVVWQTTDYNNQEQAFRGVSRNGNELPTGTYFFKIDFQSGLKSKTGFISLKR